MEKKKLDLENAHGQNAICWMCLVCGWDGEGTYSTASLAHYGNP